MEKEVKIKTVYSSNGGLGDRVGIVRASCFLSYCMFGVQRALCSLRSHGTEYAMLESKLHTGTSSGDISRDLTKSL